MRVSHSSNLLMGRAFSAGNEPMMPALHCAITSSGPETINSGEPRTGSESEFARDAGSDIRNLPEMICANIGLDAAVRPFNIERH